GWFFDGARTYRRRAFAWRGHCRCGVPGIGQSWAAAHAYRHSQPLVQHYASAFGSRLAYAGGYHHRTGREAVCVGRFHQNAGYGCRRRSRGAPRLTADSRRPARRETRLRARRRSLSCQLEISDVSPTWTVCRWLHEGPIMCEFDAIGSQRGEACVAVFHHPLFLVSLSVWLGSIHRRRITRYASAGGGSPATERGLTN